ASAGSLQDFWASPPSDRQFASATFRSPSALATARWYASLAAALLKAISLSSTLSAALFRSFSPPFSLLATSVAAFCSAAATSLATVSGDLALSQPAANKTAVAI